MICEKCGLLFKNVNGVSQHKKNCKLTIENVSEIRDRYLKDLVSINDLMEIYSLSKNLILKILNELLRSKKDAALTARIRYPDSYKHTDESKKLMSEIRLKWLKENPEKTPWRKSNMSYPEKLFLDKIIELNWDKKYLIKREKCIYPYFIDFAFENEKVAVEIDGSQHLLQDRVNSDIKKDKLLNENGWRIIRITAKEVISNIDNVLLKLNNFLESDITYENVGILKENKKIVKKDRSINIFTQLEKKNQLKQRRIERPSFEQLLKDINDTNYVTTGKKYGVSDNCIRKWVKMYEKYGIDF